jgi:hypothetical protein
MRIYDHYDTKSADFDADELNNDTITLADLSEQKIWVAWEEQFNKQGKLTKIPKDPATGDNAKVPSDPSTYGTLDDAIKCSKALRKGGIGVVLGRTMTSSSGGIVSTHVVTSTRKQSPIGRQK